MFMLFVHMMFIWC